MRGNTREMKMGFIGLLMLSVVDLNVISPKTQQLTTLPAHLAIMLLEREEPKCFQYFEQEFCRMRCISKERNRDINDNVVVKTRSAQYYLCLHLVPLFTDQCPVFCLGM